MRIPVMVLLVVAAFSPVTQAASPAKKEPWKWTLDERLGARYDERQRAARVASHMERQRGHALDRRPGVMSEDTVPLDVIDGKVNPELFLPTELFRHFVRGNFASGDNQVSRRILQHSSDDLLLTEGEWEEVAPLVAEAAASYEEELRLVGLEGEGSRLEQERAGRQLAALRDRQCKVVAAALRAIRKHYGADRFDRYLYTVVARPVSLSSFSLDPSAITYFRNREQGCE